MAMSEQGARAASQKLMEELMGSVVAIDFVLQTLMDLPADLLPGEDRAEAMRELLTSSACHEVAIVGEEACRAATALIGKVVDRMADDANAAAQMAEAAARRPC
jgi:hypothetical protein